MGRHNAGRKVRRGALVGKVRALLIGGLVFGIGSTLTLAAWTDSEHTAGTFKTSTFGIEGSTNGSSFTEHATEGAAATMAFGADGLTPGATVHAAFDVRTTAASTVGGTVVLASATASGDTAVTGNLTYRVATVSTSTSCASASYTGTAVSAASVFEVDPESLDAGAGNTVRYCFEVKMSTEVPSTAQGKTGSVTWKFDATSGQ